jgi:LPS O-antigen subunit length determinant protein (WzzB/FepE family)
MTKDQYSKFLAELEDDNVRNLVVSLERLESDIVNSLASAPLRDGKLFDLAWAVNARTQVAQQVERFLGDASDIFGGFTQINENLLETLNEYGKFTQLPSEAITGLLDITFQGFEEIANSYGDEISKQMYQMTLTNATQVEATQAIRGKINGVYQASDKDEIESLVEIVNTTTDDAVRQKAINRLHAEYGSDRLGNNLRRYASTYVRDATSQYSRASSIAIAKEAGIKKWEYFGDTEKDTREFCRKMLGRVMTEDEIREKWSSESWQGKSDGDPFIVCGGYNCKHEWLPVFED